jgi:hypothetical protein
MLRHYLTESNHAQASDIIVAEGNMIAAPGAHM